MTQPTSNKSATKIVTTLRAEVAAKDAALQTQLAAIMARKPNRPHKGESELDWLIPKSKSAKKTAPPGADLDRNGRKKPGKPKL
jgi:hypothetical protein